MADICVYEDECTIPGIILDILEYTSGLGLPREEFVGIYPSVLQVLQ